MFTFGFDDRDAGEDTIEFEIPSRVPAGLYDLHAIIAILCIVSLNCRDMNFQLFHGSGFCIFLCYEIQVVEFIDGVQRCDVNCVRVFV